jgi:ribosomal RNA-processing protein 36
MIDPASSTDDDGSSSSAVSSSRSNDEEVITRRMHHHDDADEISDDDDDDAAAANHVSNFDDLPTDDSEEESDSDNSSDDDGESNNGAQNNVEDLPLAERLAQRAKLGRRYNDTNRNYGDEDEDGGKKRRMERKNRAITLASERLRQAKKGDSFASDSSSVPGSSADDSSVEDAISNKNNIGELKKRNKSKHAPTEMSSKRRDYFARGRPNLNSSGVGVSIGANKYKPRDPRMVSLSGHLDAHVFEKRYGFLDEVQDAEIEKLKHRVSAWKTTGKKGQKARKKLGLTQGNYTLENDQEELTRLLQERAERKKASLVRAAKRSVKQKIREDVASGKGVYYPKRSELRKMELGAKFEEIRKRGGDEAVDKAIAKRRKKNVAKCHKLMPSHMIK